MVPLQKAARIPTCVADDADSVGPAQQEPLVEGQGYSRKFDILDRDLHRSEFAL